MPKFHEPVMELVRASMLPVPSGPQRRIDVPARRVITQAARADDQAGTCELVHMLAIGAAICATDLTCVLAQHKNMAPEVYLEQVDDKALRDDDRACYRAVPVVRTLLLDDGLSSAAQLMADLHYIDQDEFLDLILALGQHTAACVGIIAALRISPVESTLAALELMLRDLGDD
ncbi:hypothetical protein [Streptomyces syringium]|uniref:hypothetical protein n=1 Tax=Streptomyces syringium TaxID=76729 RepID=UPI003429D022